MEQKQFGVNLKATGKDVVRERQGLSNQTASRSIRTPLKPANVSDLKAMFDKSGGDSSSTTTTTKTEKKQGSGITTTQRTVETRTVTRTTTKNIAPDNSSGVKVISMNPQRSTAPGRTTGIKTADEILAKVRAERLINSDPKSTSYVTKHTTTRTVTQTSYDSSDPSSKITTKTVTTFDNEDKDKAREFLKFSLGRVGSGKSVSSNSSDDDSLRSTSPRSLQITSPRGYKTSDTASQGFKSSSEIKSSVSAHSDPVSISGQISPRSYKSATSASPKDSQLHKRFEIPVSHERSQCVDEDTVDSSSISEITKKYGLSSVGASKISPSSSPSLDKQHTTTFKADLKPKISNGNKNVSKKTIVRLTEKKFDILGSKPADDPLVKDGEKLIKFDITKDGFVSGYKDIKPQSDTGQNDIIPKSKPRGGTLLEEKNAKNIGVTDVKDRGSKKEIKVVHEVKVEHVPSKLKSTKIETQESKSTATSDIKKKDKKDKSSKGSLTGWLMGKKGKEDSKESKSSSKMPEDVKTSSKDVKATTRSKLEERSSKSDEKTLTSSRKPPYEDVEKVSKNLEDNPRKFSGDNLGGRSGILGTERRFDSQNMSSERFEKLKFDFERGCPTEHQDRVSKDAILLPKDLPEVKIAPKVQKSDSFKRKEESIFACGLKVSDFVQQINDSNVKTNVGRTWKKNTARVRSASASNPGENEYHEVSDGASSDGGCYSEGDGIYEFVPERHAGEEASDVDSSGKIGGRKFGIYRKQKANNKKASFKVKGKSNSLPRNKKIQKASSEENIDHQYDGQEEEDWETDSNSTTYEPVEDENLYEEAGFESDPDSRSSKKKSKDKEGKSLGEKLSSQASSVLNKFKFGKGKSKGIDSGVSATDSDADMIEESTSDEVGKSCSLSRSSSERSSGKRVRELMNDTKNVKISEDEGTSSPTPPPLPPPLPPRASVLLQQQSAENSPPLPPRNTDARLSLDTVIPINPSSPSSSSTGDLRRKGQFGKDSYLFGQQIKSASVGDVTDGDVPTDPYLDYDPAGGKLDRKDKNSTLDEKSVYSSSSSSSAASYSESDDLDSIVPLAMKTDGDNYYLEPDDEQVYGSLDRVRYSTKFDNEPLYQYYTKEKVTRATVKKCLQSDDDDDDEEGDSIYEDVGLDEDENNDVDVEMKPRITFNKGGSLHRALWCEMPEVKKSGILEKMTDKEKKIQEAMFEIITSEASYLKSLNILINVFLFSQEFSADLSDRCVITKRERTVLFSNIGAIRDASERFLADLEARWKESYIIKDICDIINSHASKNFEPYVRYCSNQKFQTRALDILKKKTEYVEAVRRLESNPDCQNLPMSSFLLLPMQRITRLPLLVDAICHRLEPNTPLHKSASKALETLNKLVKRCNEGAKKMQQTEEMCHIADQLNFSRVKAFPIRSASRYLVKKGDLTRIINDTGSRMPFGKKGATKHSVSLYLFNDLMLLTKKKGNQYFVTNYCPRNSIHVEAIDNVDKCPHLPFGVPSGCKNLFLMVMLENNEDKQMEMVLSCNSPSDRTRWIDAVTSSKNTNDADRVYEEWDCPQVQCIEKYVARESDELSLEVSDVINVLTKTKDGMFEGERIHDGERGWFPVDHTEEIVNSHVRARNLKIRYRLLIKASEEYRDSKQLNL